MDRTFQARVTIGQYLALLLCTFMAGYGLWNKEWPIALVFMLLLVFIIEQLIHSAYTVRAEGELVIRRGRFRKVVHIALQDISLAELTCWCITREEKHLRCFPLMKRSF